MRSEHFWNWLKEAQKAEVATVATTEAGTETEMGTGTEIVK